MALDANETQAEYAVLLDYNTGTTLLAKNAETPVGPSSMSKLMTVYLVFEALKNGTLHLEDTLPVSEKAWRMGGSKMFVGLGTDVKVEDLLRGVIIQSGNDACIVLAEGLAGSEGAFAEAMNNKAEQLSMTQSHFVNATGWPDEEHVMSVRDLAILARHLISDFPEYYHYFAEPEFKYNNIKQYNRNTLINRGIGADGLKTGHTEAAGYGLVSSAEKDGRRLILVVNGLGSMKERISESERLLRYGFNSFKEKTLFRQDTEITDARVWMGKEGRVPLVLAEEVRLLVSRVGKGLDGFKAHVEYEGPVPAPIKHGQEIGKLVV
ncbi:MAG: D-alanyl-D-alanine carboxypeptidase, partial [Rickettsiales bacterium]|nr:D-alanyl-D-alanine carboxypeptidase [Rickettsiales bacterium]